MDDRLSLIESNMYSAQTSNTKSNQKAYKELLAIATEEIELNH